jgi:hypothetical protein
MFHEPNKKINPSDERFYELLLSTPDQYGCISALLLLSDAQAFPEQISGQRPLQVNASQTSDAEYAGLPGTESRPV